MKTKKSKFKIFRVQPAWTPFQQLRTPPEGPNMPGEPDLPNAVAENSRYIVRIYQFDTPNIGIVTQLSIQRKDGGSARDWEDLQRVKNEIMGPNVEACEVFPSESRKVDSNNRFYLWCLPAPQCFPFGIHPHLRKRPEPIEAISILRKGS